MKKYNLKSTKLIKEAGEPQIGIFWLYSGQILQFTQPASQIPIVGGFKDSNYTHDNYWEQMIKLFPELADKEYFSIPRGRVLFVANGTYKIILPAKEAGNKTTIQRIINNFNLPKGKTVTEIDEHYGDYSED